MLFAARTTIQKLLCLAVFIPVLLMAGVFGGPDRAFASGPVLVNSFEDSVANDGLCTLREAIIAVNRGRNDDCPGAGADTILLPPGVYTLTRLNAGNEDAALTGDLDIVTNLTIAPAEPGLVVIDGGASASRVFQIISGQTTLRDLTIRRGGGANGAGLYVNQGASVTLENVTLTANIATGQGGALYVEGGAEANLRNVTMIGNGAPSGAAVHNNGAVHMVNTIAGANGNIANPACSGNPPSGAGPNLVVSASCATVNATLATELGMSAQTDGVGVTFWTISKHSPALDAGNDAQCPPRDQLGTPRPQRSGCDIGAHELIQHPPIPSPVTVTTNEGTPLTIVLSGADADDAALTFTIVEWPNQGSLGPVNQSSPAEAAVLYTPPVGFSGVVTFTYAVNNGYESSLPALVTVNVSPAVRGPVAVNDTLVTAEDTPGTISVAANDQEGDSPLVPSSVSITLQPAFGSVVANGDGTITYTPPPNWFGTTSFTYAIVDEAGISATASVAVLVTPVNDPPVAVDDSLEVLEDFSGTVNVVANDYDVDGNLDPTSVTILAQPSQGVAVTNGDGTVTYSPPPHWWGTTAFQYAVYDTGGLSATATVWVTVLPDEFLEVTTTADDGPGSLRDALTQANADPELSKITFDLPGAGPHVIYLNSVLPAVHVPVHLDGATQPVGQVIVDGQGGDFPGLVLLSGASGSTIRGLIFRNFGGSGIVLQQSGDNLLVENTISGNGGDGITILGDANDPYGTGNNQIVANTITDNQGNGVTIVESVQNELVENNFAGNGGLPLDLGGDGRTPNDLLDQDIGANFTQNYPVLFRAVPGGVETGAAVGQASDGAPSPGRIDGWLHSKPNQTFSLQVYVSELCNRGAEHLIATEPAEVTTGDDGTVYFALATVEPLQPDWAVRVTARDAQGNTSEYSDCVVVSIDNDSWPRALPLDVRGPVTVQQYIDVFGQARWYRFSIQPQSQVEVLLTNLPANYDLTIYKDLSAAYEELLAPQDPNRLSAEFAPSAFSPSAFSPSAFSPSAFSPSAFSPSAFSPSAFSPSAFSPSAFSPSAFSPSAFSPSAFSPSAFSPSAFSPSAFSPSAFSPSAFSPSALDPSAYANAQARSVIGVSAFDGTAGEGLVVNTWNNTGDFYVRVRGREGEHSVDAPFRLQVTVTPGPCENLPADATLPPLTLAAVGGGYKSIILVDGARLRERYEATQVDLLLAQLNVLAVRPEVKGVIVDVSADARVAAANARADSFYGCPYAKNVVAESIRRVIQAYHKANPIEYVVLVGNDDVIPFFRYPDNALIGHESNYVPPVRDNTASQASLRLGYVLSQDAYGATVDLSLNATLFPLPDLAVGRLVETPSDILTLLSAYLGTAGGVAPTPQSAFVTGYDFLEDAALAVQAELEAGLGRAVDALITPQDVSPLDPTAWTASQLKGKLSAQRYDIVFLAGHFNAVSALAADYRTSFLATELLALPVDLTNSLFFSAGCHSGYNIVTPHGVPGVTFEPDWAQVFAQRGATLVAGTGYQYGDTEFLEYSERLYLEFTRKLRTGDGPVPVGKALVAAKQRYLATTPFLRGIHEKAVLEATLFGLPMFAVNMPGARLPADNDVAVITETSAVTSAPGGQLGLRYADLSIVPQLAERVLELTNVDDGSLIEAQWLEGRDGVVTNPAEPALPLESRNVGVPGLALRGVAFRGGDYRDASGILPLTGAPTTELRGVHAPFLSDVWFPLRPWGTNYFGVLTGDDVTRLNVTPAQHRSDATGGVAGLRRQFERMEFRLFYTPYAVDAASVLADGQGSLSDAPSIVQARGLLDGNDIVFRVRVVGNPAAGLQEVWVTYTALEGPWLGRWQSLDLVQSIHDSTLWEGRLNLGATPADAVRFMAQAVNGLGLVALAENLGRYYTPGAAVTLTATSLELLPLAAQSAVFGDVVTLASVLRDHDGNPLAGLPVIFAVGPQERLAVTDGSGRAQATIPLLGRTGRYLVSAAFDGNNAYAASAVTGDSLFTIGRQTSSISIDPPFVSSDSLAPGLMTATLVDPAGRRLVEQTVFWVIEGDKTQVQPVITNLVGEAKLGSMDLPPGTYSVRVRFDGSASHTATTSPVGELRLTLLDPTSEAPAMQPVGETLYLPVLGRP